jgi:hypothetical protein
MRPGTVDKSEGFELLLQVMSLYTAIPLTRLPSLGTLIFVRPSQLPHRSSTAHMSRAMHQVVPTQSKASEVLSASTAESPSQDLVGKASPFPPLTDTPLSAQKRLLILLHLRLVQAFHPNSRI